jgi:hypothetical protein
MLRHPHSDRRVRRAVVTLIGTIVIAAVMIPAPAVAAVSSTKPSDPQNAPTFQQQTKNWTAAQLQQYSNKLRTLASVPTANVVGGSSPLICVQCTCGCPDSYYVTMSVIYEGAADCACGPATATEMFTTLTHNFNSPPAPGLSLSQVESQMKFDCSLGTYRPQLQNEMYTGSGFSYVWVAVASAADVHRYTSVDLAEFLSPVAYDGETYGVHGHPLDNYPSVDWKHYFPAYGYSTGHLSVADPHFNYKHTYTDVAVYNFIDNFPYANQVMW